MEMEIVWKEIQGGDKRFFDDIEEIVCLAVLIINW